MQFSIGGFRFDVVSPPVIPIGPGDTYDVCLRCWKKPAIVDHSICEWCHMSELSRIHSTHEVGGVDGPGNDLIRKDYEPIPTVWNGLNAGCHWRNPPRKGAS